jgi:hypothetical protein
VFSFSAIVATVEAALIPTPITTYQENGQKMISNDNTCYSMIYMIFLGIREY